MTKYPNSFVYKNYPKEQDLITHQNIDNTCSTVTHIIYKYYLPIAHTNKVKLVQEGTKRADAVAANEIVETDKE